MIASVIKLKVRVKILSAAAFLVFLSAPARAGIVPAHFRSFSFYRRLFYVRRPRFSRLSALGSGYPRCERTHLLMYHLLREGFEDTPGFFLGCHLYLKDKFQGIFLDPVHHLLEHCESLVLVFDERIDLAVRAEAYAFFQDVHRVEMILPLRIDHIQQYSLLDMPRRVGPEDKLPLFVKLIYYFKRFRPDIIAVTRK